MDKNSIGIGVVIVVRNDDKILFGKRLVKVGNGQWGLPGGHLEPGESMVAGAKRELLEETGLVADDLEFVNITNDPRPGDEHWIHLVFLAKDIHGEPKNTEPNKCGGWDGLAQTNCPSLYFMAIKNYCRQYYITNF